MTRASAKKPWGQECDIGLRRRSIPKNQCEVRSNARLMTNRPNHRQQGHVSAKLMGLANRRHIDDQAVNQFDALL